MRLTFIVIACLLLPAISYSQKGDEQLVRNVLAAQTNAWNNGNIDVFMETYWKNDSLVFIGKGGPTYGWQTTLNNYKKRYPDTVAMGKLNFDLLQLRPLPGDYYFVIGNWHLKRTTGDIGGVFTLLLRKINGKWVIVADHTS
ncbi:MAG TPA: nuclear transport factor 2 family protein [Chitinophagaceae bacterium]|nr:nuclear transport factor 2 family protein [Chitinophagaceae bacterium]